MGMGIAESYVSALSAWQAQKDAMDRLRKAESRASRLAELYGPPKPRAAPSKCPGCGSREFKSHHGKKVCSFCRIEATYDQD